MGRFVFAAVMGAMLWIVQPAYAAVEPVAGPATRDAEALAKAIRKSAHRSGGLTPSAVRWVHGEGARWLEVAYSARPGSLSKGGGYVLQAGTNVLGNLQVSIAEYPTWKASHPWKLPTGMAAYKFVFDPANFLYLSYAAFPGTYVYTTRGIRFEEYGEAELTSAELEPLYKQAARVIQKAEHHSPLTKEQQLHPGLPCGLPNLQSCKASDG